VPTGEFVTCQMQILPEFGKNLDYFSIILASFYKIKLESKIKTFILSFDISLVKIGFLAQINKCTSP
jgi:hypothetical protein